MTEEQSGSFTDYTMHTRQNGEASKQWSEEINERYDQIVGHTAVQAEDLVLRRAMPEISDQE